MLELTLRQCGLVGRVLEEQFRKTKGGKIVKRVHERYLHDDIGCCLSYCRECSLPRTGNSLTDLISISSSTFPYNHAVIVDAFTFIKHYNVLDDENFKNIVITQSVWEEVKKSNPPAYKVMYSLCYEKTDRNFVVFMDQLHHATFLETNKSISREERLDESLLKTAIYYKEHWLDYNIKPILICGTEEKKNRLINEFPNTFTIKEYIQGFKNCNELLDKMSYEEKNSVSGPNLFLEHLSQQDLLKGLQSGRFKKGTFKVSRENYLEATVTVDENATWFLQGRANCNRAVDGDIVAVELLPKEHWTCPKKLIKLRDLEEIEKETEVEADVDDENDHDIEKSPTKKQKLEDNYPSARVVGIIRRNWRQYCGMILKPAVKDSKRVLFAPAERLIPRIRIETRQVEQLLGKRIIVVIDNWPRDSRYPVGHYVRSIGEAGDRETENEVLLLEHDIPHSPFSDDVLSCLPKLPWRPSMEDHRKDLRSTVICSVDPPGCTDIDDALHCKQISDNLFEVGVHIADVSHFVRPATSLDAEAAERGTTVYLCDRRIDMLPDLLSSNLCSLIENEDRFAFSVIWTLTSSADVINIKFHKSLIRSKRSLTYEMAQNMIDDPNCGDEITGSLRNLLMLSKKLKEKRQANGALQLASSEIRFNFDSETKNPINIQEKRHLDTNSMVEEFMLLANITVAERICTEFPDCSVLRKHPEPSKEKLKSFIELAKLKGHNINMESGKALAESLDKAVDPNDRMFNILLRMLTTRCLSEAVYFCSGSLPVEQYIHFGLAASIYTHFTSPIRRYADIAVHRLLASAIKAHEVFPAMLDRKHICEVTNNLNYRHRQARFAGRASVLLNTILFFKGRKEYEDAYIMGIRSNGIQVLVPKYGLESVIVFPSSAAFNIMDDRVVAGNVTIRILQSVKVQISLDESNVQHIRLDVKLVSPEIPGFSVDMISSPDEIE